MTGKSAPGGAHNAPLVEAYRMMRRIRDFEERVGELFLRGESAGAMLHLSNGEEAAAVGVCKAMTPEDTFTTHHRGHGIFLARGAEPDRMMAEIAGKAEGYCHGKGGSMHIADMDLGHLGANAIVGGGIPAVVGAALSEKRLRGGAVSVAFFGDGAMGQGLLYESMNMAALWKLPAVFVCINNQYGMGTRVDKASASLDFDARARSFGLNARIVDGIDVEAVEEAAAEIVGAARKGEPGFLMVEAYRFYGHARKDKSPYRDAAEEAEGRKRDPIAFTRAALIASGAVDAPDLDAIDAASIAEMDASVDFAIAGARPDKAVMFRDVYGDGQPETRQARFDRILSAEA